MSAPARCRGHCCRGFALEKPLEEIREDYERWREDPASARIPDIATIAPMLVPLRRVRGEWLYTCRNLRANGDCGIYEKRPAMCRDFPARLPCPYGLCAMNGRKNLFAKIVAWMRT
jgi:Fe-S-cluster containining protein